MPQLSGMAGDGAYVVGLLIQHGIGIFIGMTYGMLFYRDIKGTGSGII